MVSEIYACGHDRTSGFVIVENGEMVHFGSNKWGENITFEGVTGVSDDVNCEVIAVVCAVMMCQGNHRRLVNIYTDDERCQKRYYRKQSDSPFCQSFERHSEGIDVYAEPWTDGNHSEDFKKKCLDMCK